MLPPTIPLLAVLDIPTMARSGSSRRRVADYDWSTRSSKSSTASRKKQSSSKQKAKEPADDRSDQHTEIVSRSSRSVQKQQPKPPTAALEERQVDAYENPTVVFQCINYGDWDGAADRAASHPKEAATWIVRHETSPTTQSTSTDRGRKGKTDDNEEKIKWRYLPLHLACLQRNPSLRLVKQLLAVFPSAASRCDHDGNLPLHLVCNSSGGKNQGIVRLLVDAYPKGSSKKNSKRRTSADILRRKIKDGTLTSSDARAAMAIIAEREKTKQKKQRRKQDAVELRDDDKSNDSSGRRRDAAAHSRDGSNDSSSWYMSDDEAISAAAPATSSVASSRSSNPADGEIMLRWRSMEESLQNEIRQLENSLDETTTERDMLRDEVFRVERRGQEEARNKERQIDDLTRTVVELEERAAEADDLRYQAIEHIEQIDVLAEENSGLKHELELLVADLHEAHHRLDVQEQDFDERLEAAREEMAVQYTQHDRSVEETDAVPVRIVDELQTEMEDLRAERDALADMLATDRDRIGRGQSDLEIRCGHLEEQLDVYHENDIHLKQELQGMTKERDELLDKVDSIQREAKQDATNAKAAFDARQKALRDEIQSIWNVVKAISQSSPSKNGELMERILELGENQEETTDGSVNEADVRDDANEDDQAGYQSMLPQEQGTNAAAAVDDKDENIPKPVGISAAPSQQSTAPGTDQDTISAISENTGMWGDELDLDGIAGIDDDEDLDVVVIGTNSGNDERNIDNTLSGDKDDNHKWLADMDDEVKALEEECKALGLQFEEEKED